MRRDRSDGFTLVELIIVIIILGILAALAIPQFTSSTKDAKEATLQGNLAVMRNAINLYFHQHASNYPGAINNATGAAATAAEMEPAFIAQMNTFSDRVGKTSTTKDAAHPFGPYLMSRVIPDNPLPTVDTTAPSVNAVNATTDAGPVTADGTALKGWKFSTVTGQFICNNVTYQGF